MSTTAAWSERRGPVVVDTQAGHWATLPDSAWLSRAAAAAMSENKGAGNKGAGSFIFFVKTKARLLANARQLYREENTISQ
jgi:L-aminopeptidase/D-esterase-like protein